MRTPHGYSTSPISGTDENLLYGLAGFWVLEAVALPVSTQLSTMPMTVLRTRPSCPLTWGLHPVRLRLRTACKPVLTHGWAALNTSDRTTMVRVPQDQGLVDAQNNAAPATLTLEGHRGVIYRKR